MSVFPHSVVCTPQLMSAVLDRLPKATPGALCALSGMRVYTKEEQRADCWMFSDDELLTKYLGGTLSEENLRAIEAHTEKVAQS